MLINLLAESQGLPEALRVLALFEHQFAMLWEAKNVRLLQKMPSVFTVAAVPSLAANGGAKVKFKEEDGKKEKKEALDTLGEDKGKRPQTLVVTWDDAEIADYFYKYGSTKLTVQSNTLKSGF